MVCNCHNNLKIMKISQPTEGHLLLNQRRRKCQEPTLGTLFCSSEGYMILSSIEDSVFKKDIKESTEMLFSLVTCLIYIYDRHHM